MPLHSNFWGTLSGAQPSSLSSYGKIEEAFKTGKIDLEKSLKLKLLAVLSPELLPAEFQGEKLRRLEGDNVLREIIYYKDKISPSARDLFSPFLLPPEDKNSFFNPSNAEQRSFLLQQIVKSL